MATLLARSSLFSDEGRKEGAEEGGKVKGGGGCVESGRNKDVATASGRDA